MTDYVIGVDGGGTKTRGGIAKLDGSVIKIVEVGSTNYNAYPLTVVRQNMQQLIDELVNAVSAKTSDIKAIVLGLSGCDRPEDKPVFIKMMSEMLPGTKCLPVNDAVVALYGGAGQPLGIQVISGTGSIAYGFDGPDKHMRCGGWGNVLGDEGSGWALGLNAMRAVIREHDGIGPKTALTKLIIERLNLNNPTDLVGWVRKIQVSKSEIAALSRLVFIAAEAGDAIAINIMKTEAAELAKQTAHVGKTMFAGRNDYKIVVGGGNLRNCKQYFDLFKQLVAELLPGIEVIQPAKEPVEGAIMYAQSLAAE